MYILASDLFRKRQLKKYLKLEVYVICGEYLAFKYILFVFFKKNQMIYSAFKSGISVPFEFMWAKRYIRILHKKEF